MLTYGDGVCTVDLDALMKFHQKKGQAATITAIQPGGRFGLLDMDNGATVKRFSEKDLEAGGWINGGYMLLEPRIFDYIEGDSTVFEREPLERLAADGQLNAFKHTGFWKCMDTLREKEGLDYLWIDEGGRDFFEKASGHHYGSRSNKKSIRSSRCSMKNRYRDLSAFIYGRTWPVHTL